MGQAAASSLRSTVRLVEAAAWRTMQEGAAVAGCICWVPVRGKGITGHDKEGAPVQGCLPSAHTCREVGHSISCGPDRVCGRTDRSAQCSCALEHSQSQWLTQW